MADDPQPFRPRTLGDYHRLAQQQQCFQVNASSISDMADDPQPFRPRTLGDYHRLAQQQQWSFDRRSWRDTPYHPNFGSNNNNPPPRYQYQETQYQQGQGSGSRNFYSNSHFQNQNRSAHPNDTYSPPYVPPHQELEPAVPAEFNNFMHEQVKMNQMFFEQMQAINEKLARLARGNVGAGSSGTQYSGPALPEETDPTVAKPTNADSAEKAVKTAPGAKPCDPAGLPCDPQDDQQGDKQSDPEAVATKSSAPCDPARHGDRAADKSELRACFAHRTSKEQGCRVFRAETPPATSTILRRG